MWWQIENATNSDIQFSPHISGILILDFIWSLSAAKDTFMNNWS